jgi:hypothetical protein
LASDAGKFQVVDIVCARLAMNGATVIVLDGVGVVRVDG